MHCNNCGNQVKDGVSFCPHCGKQIETNSKDTNNIYPKSWKIPAIIGGVSLIAVIAVISVAVSMRGGDSVPISQSNTIVVHEKEEKITKVMSDVEKLFTAFENTIKAPSYKLSRTYYDWDNVIGQDMGMSGIYAGYLVDAEKYMSDERSYFKCTIHQKNIYSKDGTVFLDDNTDGEASERIIDYSEPNDEDLEEILLLNTFNDFKSGNAENFWNHSMVFESSPLMLPYRHWKIALSDLLKAYQKDKESVAFVKNYQQEDDTYLFEMYAKDFYLWYEKLSDSYEIPIDVKENLFTSDIDKVYLKIGFTIKGDYLSDFYIFHSGENNGKTNKDGVHMVFSEINELSEKSSDAYQVISAFEREIKAGDYKHALRMYLEHYMKKSYEFAIFDGPDGVPVILKKGSGTAIVYDGYFYEEDNSYNLSSYDEAIKDMVYYRANIILDYVEHGTPLPEIPVWKDAYVQYLESNKNDDYKYSMVYIDNDDIPELLVHMGLSRWDSVSVLTYTNGAVQTVLWDELSELGNCGTLKIKERDGIVIGDGGGAGWHITSYYQLQNGVANQLHYYLSEGDSYVVDGEDVSEQDFDKKSKEIANMYENAAIYDYDSSGRNRSDMINALQGEGEIITKPSVIMEVENNNSTDYILPDSDSRYLSDQDLSGLSKDQLKLARNEIYARHGYIFTKEDTKQYFGSKSWYSGTVAEVTDDMFNEFEIANRDLIISVEGN